MYAVDICDSFSPDERCVCYLDYNHTGMHTCILNHQEWER